MSHISPTGSSTPTPPPERQPNVPIVKCVEEIAQIENELAGPNPDRKALADKVAALKQELANYEDKQGPKSKDASTVKEIMDDLTTVENALRGPAPAKNGPLGPEAQQSLYDAVGKLQSISTKS